MPDIDAVIAELRGVTCWRARFGYGDELLLDLGAHQPYESPLLAGGEHGEWVLGTRASAWRVVGPEPDVARLEGARVVVPTISHPNLDLTLRFDADAALEVTADPDEQDLAAWELFTPSGMLLQAGPGRRWSYTRADERR